MNYFTGKPTHFEELVMEPGGAQDRFFSCQEQCAMEDEVSIHNGAFKCSFISRPVLVNLGFATGHLHNLGNCH